MQIGGVFHLEQPFQAEPFNCSHQSRLYRFGVKMSSLKLLVCLSLLRMRQNAGTEGEGRCCDSRRGQQWAVNRKHPEGASVGPKPQKVPWDLKWKPRKSLPSAQLQKGAQEVGPEAIPHQLHSGTWVGFG